MEPLLEDGLRKPSNRRAFQDGFTPTERLLAGSLDALSGTAIDVWNLLRTSLTAIGSTRRQAVNTKRGAALLRHPARFEVSAGLIPRARPTIADLWQLRNGGPYIKTRRRITAAPCAFRCVCQPDSLPTLPCRQRLRNSGLRGWSAPESNPVRHSVSYWQSTPSKRRNVDLSLAYPLVTSAPSRSTNPLTCGQLRAETQPKAHVTRAKT